MGKVTTGFSTSLDGFIAGPGDDVQHLFAWYGMGDTELPFPSGTFTAKVSAASAEHLRGRFAAAGALVTGRRQFDLTHGWGGRHPLDVPVFVVTHSVPQDWPAEGTPFAFVTDGVESAISHAQEVAGAKDVIVDGATVAQQAIRAGLVDEVGVDLVPVLLGDGVRFFDNLGSDPIQLEQTGLIQGAGVTHIIFRVLQKA